MVFDLLLSNPIHGIIFLLAIGLAIGIHEAAHAWAADKLGDPTAKLMGRTTINPLAHLDLVGTLLFLFAGFGWGKPVPVDERRLKSNQDIVKVALAGPASNLITAIILGIAYRLIPLTGVQEVLSLFIFINLSLMLFNLIPIPPLDGSKLLKLIVPEPTYDALVQYGFFLIIILFLMFRIGNLGLGDWLLRGVDILFRFITQATFSL
ncbi:MAG TPA: site-2 protease family protein [Patescibacteria group bacterium]